jgi:hypothetical protein
MKRQLFKPIHGPAYDSNSECTLSVNNPDIFCVGATPFMSLARKRGYETCAFIIADIDQALAVKKHTDPLARVPPEYYDLIDAFSRDDSDQLPVLRSYNHKIELIKDKQHGFGPWYGMSQDELKLLREYLKDHLSKGFIRASSFQSPLLLYLLRNLEANYASASTAIPWT